MNSSNFMTNFTSEKVHDDSETEFEPTEIPIVITAVISALANVLIIVIIARYTILRTCPNLYLANCCIANLIVMLLMPPYLNLFGMIDAVEYEYMCIWDEAIYGLMFGNLIFATVLLLDWYITCYTRRTCSTRCIKMNLFIIAIVWIITLSVSVASVSFCALNFSYPLSVISFNFGLSIIFLALLFVFIMTCIKIYIFKDGKEKSKLELIIVTTYFLCWLPNKIATYGPLFLNFPFSYTFEHISYFVINSYGWILLITLYFFDKSFRLCFRKMFCDTQGMDENASMNKEQSAVLL